MKVVWSDWALDQLDEIHTFLELEASERIADRTVAKILEAVALLQQYPLGGQVEPWLEHKGLGHRRAVVGNYKLIYRIHKNEIRITDVFDARQDPGKMRG
ncbi:MAG: type II toxin-antitoxin system RelE/ParE family toxin [Flavobacteriales bacterium]|nr:type II toxin-antitoxin system RelE/ParE family toxin [Flavobacteriales bacterium]